MPHIQCYATLNDLIADAENTALDVSVLQRFILPASVYISGEIGLFLPMADIRRRTGRCGSPLLYIPPMLRLTGNVTNYQTTLTSDDYQILSTQDSDQPCWKDGPYLLLRAAPDAPRLADWFDIPNCVTIPAVWGLYERSETLETALDGAQLFSDETLTVENGGVLSPGMTLLIGSEWQFIRGYGAPTAAVTALDGALDASSETLSLNDGAAVQVGEIIRVQVEQMRVEDINGTDIYVTRGWNRTTKSAHADSASVDVYRTFAVTRAVNGSLVSDHADGASLARMCVPDDINYLTRQIATLMMKKSQTGYAGRAGNASGETFYNFEFPRDAIERVKANYYLPTTR